MLNIPVWLRSTDENSGVEQKMMDEGMAPPPNVERDTCLDDVGSPGPSRCRLPSPVESKADWCLEKPLAIVSPPSITVPLPTRMTALNQDDERLTTLGRITKTTSVSPRLVALLRRRAHHHAWSHYLVLVPKLVLVPSPFIHIPSAQSPRA